LHGIAGLRLEEPQLRLGRDPLGHELEIEAMAERDDGADDRGIVRILADIGNEGAVLI
jgi:hypothetical protein